MYLGLCWLIRLKFKNLEQLPCLPIERFAFTDSKPCKRKELFRSGSPEEPAEEVSKLATSVAANISDPLLEQVSYILNQMPISETISSNQQASLEPKQIPLEPILKSQYFFKKKSSIMVIYV